jgi:nicotinamide-nucleotide amidase
MAAGGVSILITGSEVLDGRVSDTNSHHLVRELASRGFEIRHVLSCGDFLETLKDAIGALVQRSDAVVISGGIGPTADDNTRRAVAAFLGRELEVDAGALAHLEEFYRSRRRVLDDVNKRQSYVPRGAAIIPNPMGTAPGFYCELPEGKMILSIPGVPAEMKKMFEATVLPLLLERFTPAPRYRHLVRMFGLPEAGVGGRIERAGIDDSVEIAYRAAFPEVHLQLSAGDSAVVAAAAAKVREAIAAEYIVAENDVRPFEEILQEMILARGLTISAAESCTGGMVSALLTNTAGSSACFIGSSVTYCNEAKTRLLGVKPETRAAHGAVSIETAREMAEGARRAFGTDIAISVTGIAGPTGGSTEKPVGTFVAGYADKSGSEAHRFFLGSTRERVRGWAARTALDVVRRKLLGIPIGGR